jgi:hypothetical protein
MPANAALANIGEIYSGHSVSLFFNDPATDARTPDIVVTPNVGVVYTGGVKKVAEHGGFNNDDVSVMLLVSNTGMPQATVNTPVQTTQIAPTILSALTFLGVGPQNLQAVQAEQTPVLPGLIFR